MELQIRHEQAKVLAHLMRYFGPQYIGPIDVCLQATVDNVFVTWPVTGFPASPANALLATAKNKMLGFLNQKLQVADAIKVKSIQCLINTIELEEASLPPLETDFRDNQLRVLFACCSSGLTSEQQTVLVLKFMCGYTNSQIEQGLHLAKGEANSTIQASIPRFKRNWSLFLPEKHRAASRINRALRILNRIFYKGYLVNNATVVLNKSFCEDAIRIANIIVGNANFNTANVHALLALMNFKISRFHSFTGIKLLSDEEQNTGNWNKDSLFLAWQHFKNCADIKKQTEYQLEAGIIAELAVAGTFENVDWEIILNYYDSLIKVRPRTTFMLNRVMVFAQIHGACKALKELNKIKTDGINHNYLYYAIKSDLLNACGKCADASLELKKAIVLSNSELETERLQQKLAALAQ